MGDDKWAEAWSGLTTAVENAVEAGMTKQEIQDAVDEVINTDNVPHVGGGPKRPKK